MVSVNPQPKKQNRFRSHCPMNFALESFGDAWSLLIVRDIVFWGKKTFKEFSASKERIASNVLSSRLAKLVGEGILEKRVDPKDKRKVAYRLTEKGLALIPIILEMSGWGTRYDSKTTSPKAFVERVYAERQKMFDLIHKTILSGGSLFAGPNSVISKIGL